MERDFAMKKILFLLAAVGAFAIGAMLTTVDVKAQCNGVFPNNTICGNTSGTPAPPSAIPTSSISVTEVGGATSSIQFNSNGNFGGATNSVVSTNGSVDMLATATSSTTARLLSARLAQQINVKDFGATGNGSTDDTTAINAAIAQFNLVGKGVLYFPAGTYKTTTGLTPITGNGIVKGDGQTNLSNQLGSTSSLGGVAALPGTLIQETSTTAPLFSVTGSQALTFQDLSIQNSSGGTPVAGSAGVVVNSGIQLTATAPTPTTSTTLTFSSVPVTVTTGIGVWDTTSQKTVGIVSSISSPTITLVSNASNAVATNDVVNLGGIGYQKVDYQNFQVSGFFIGIDVKSGALWTLNNVQITGPVQYGIRVNNFVNVDAGDWTISDSSFYTASIGNPYLGATSAIRIEGSGGGKIVNTKINAGNGVVSGFANGIDVVGTGQTSDLLVSNCSIENFTSFGIVMAGNWFNTNLTGLQFLAGSGGATSAMKLSTNRNVSINGITLAGVYSGPGVDFSSGGNILQDSHISGVTYTAGNTSFGGNNVISTNGIQNNASINDIVGTIMGEGLGVTVVGSPTAGTSYPGSMGVSSNGRTEFWIQGGGGAIQALTFGAPGPIWKFINDASNVMRINRNGLSDVAVLNGVGHVSLGGGSTPTIAGGCGGTSSVVAGNDAVALVTGQNSSVTSCIVQFANAYSSAPTCIASGNTSPLLSNIGVSTTSITVHFTGTTSYQWSYHCFGT